MEQTNSTEEKILSRTLSVASFKKEPVERSEEKRLKRWDSLRVVAGRVNRSVSGLSSDFANRVTTVRNTRTKTSASLRSKKQSVASVRTPKASTSTMRGSRRSKKPDARTLRGASIRSQSSAYGASTTVRPHQLFGVPLEDVMSKQERDPSLARCHVPLFVNKLVEHITIRGGREEGMLRLAASREETDRVKQQLNENKPVDLYAVNIHAIGDLLKSFVRDLPGGLLDSSKWDRWMAIAELEDVKQRTSQCKALVLELDHYKRALITVLFTMFKDMLRYESRTKMTSVNLSKVFAPNVLQCTNQMTALQAIPKVAVVVETLISQYAQIFKELKEQHPIISTIDAKKAAALRPTTSSKRALRSVPAVPTPVKKENVAEAIQESPPKRQRLSKQKSEGVFMQRFQKTAPKATLSRANTSMGFADAENEQNSPHKSGGGLTNGGRGPGALSSRMVNL